MFLWVWGRLDWQLSARVTQRPVSLFSGYKSAKTPRNTILHGLKAVANFSGRGLLRHTKAPESDKSISLPSSPIPKKKHSARNAYQDKILPYEKSL
jgi:hypothetical protein